MTTTAVTKTCPPWCVEDERQDDTTLDRCHPDDFITWHNGPKRPIPGGVVELRLFDPDVLDEGKSFEPELYIAGSDIEGRVLRPDTRTGRRDARPGDPRGDRGRARLNADHNARREESDGRCHVSAG
jgi:hypothetical protein